MNKSTTDVGLLQVLLERLEKQRLPRLLELKKKVVSNKPLDDLDLDFLETSIDDARKFLPLIERNPEYQPLAAKVMSLYKEISETALQIDKSS